MIVVDGISHVSMANGLVRIGLTVYGADGKSNSVEELAVPASQLNNFLNALAKGAQNLQQQVEEHRRQQASQQEAVDPAEAGDNFQF